MTGERFLRQYRLRRGADFERVFQRRRSAADEWLLVYACPNDLAHPRLGLSVSRKVGGAVVRNRWKRLIREAFRLCRADLPAGLDLVVIPRSAARPELEPLKKSLVSLAERIGNRLAKEAR